MNSTPEQLAARMAGQTDQQLLAMFAKRSDWTAEALSAAKAELEKRNIALPPEPTTTDQSIEKSEMKGSLGWRVARLFAILVFPFFCVGLSSGIAMLISGRFGIGSFSLIIWALLCVASILSVKWFSKRSFPTATGKSYDGRMMAIGGMAILYLGLFFSLKSPSDTVWGLISAASYLLVGIGGVWMLLRSRRFVWQKYAVVGVAILALVMPIYIPQMQTVAGLSWKDDHEKAFQSLIQEAEEAGLCTGNTLNGVVAHEVDLGSLQRLKGPIIVLVADHVTDSASRLAISAVSGLLPKNLRAESSSDVRVLLIHGEPGPFRGSLAQTKDLVTPVLLYSWPDKKMAGSGRLVIGEMGWGISRGEAYHRIAQKICEAINTNRKNQ